VRERERGGFVGRVGRVGRERRGTRGRREEEGDGRGRGGWGWGGGSTCLEGFLLLLLAVGGGGVEGAVFVFGHLGRGIERLWTKVCK